MGFEPMMGVLQFCIQDLRKFASIPPAFGICDVSSMFRLQMSTVECERRSFAFVLVHSSGQSANFKGNADDAIWLWQVKRVSGRIAFVQL